MRTSLLVLAVLFLCVPDLSTGQEKQPQDVLLSELGTKYRLLGKLKQPLGSLVVAQGIVVDGPFKGHEGGPNIRVQRINGQAIQEDIQIQLIPYFGKFGDRPQGGLSLPKLAFGQTYEIEAYETGGFVGVPTEAYAKADIAIQTTGYYFSHSLSVLRAKQINPLSFSPAEFVDRSALLEGVAETRDGRSYISGADWQLLVADTPWPKHVQSKLVEGRGVVRKTGMLKTYELERGTTGLVRLQDQVGQRVALRGRMWSLNDHWWFEYRGIDMYVENLEKMPRWDPSYRGQPLVIRGVLDEAMLPALDQITLKPDRDLKKHYIVREPSWEFTDPLLSPERGERP